MMEFVDIVGCFAVLVTVCLHCPGIFTCRQIILNETVGSLTHLPFLAASMMGALWMMYGIIVSDGSIFTVNVIGAILQSSYFLVYYKYSEDIGVLQRDGGIALVFLISVAFYFFVLNSPTNENGASALGIVCNIFTVLFFASPLSTMSQVIKNKSTESMSLPLSIMSMVVAGSWLLYGGLIKDVLVQLPNAIGVLLSAAQLSLFCKYPRKRETLLHSPV